MATETPRVEAVDRALLLLQALADAGPSGATLAELAATVEVNKSTAYRALSTLRLRGFAEQDGDTAPYRLGPASYALADSAFAPQHLTQALQPALVALSAVSDELVHLGVMTGDKMLYLDKVEPERAIRVWSSVGQRVPVASTSMGRALLAARGVPDSQLVGYLKGLPADRQVSLQRLTETVQAARRCGYAVEVGENEPDVSCLGTAILRGADPIAAVSITALAARMTEQRQRELAGLIVTEAGPLLPAGLSLAPALVGYVSSLDEPDGSA